LPSLFSFLIFCSLTILLSKSSTRRSCREDPEKGKGERERERERKKEEEGKAVEEQ
jgi:hypothetical protein